MTELDETANPLMGFDDFFRTEFPRLSRLLGAADASAADALQDAFFKASQAWSKVSVYDDPAAWVRRVAVHRMLDERRSNRRRAAADLNLVRSELTRRGRKPRSGRRVAVGVVAVAAAIGSAGYVAGKPESGSLVRVKVVAPDRTTTTTNVAILREADFVNAFHADLDCLRKHGFGATRDSYIAFYRGGGVQVSIGSWFGAPQSNGAVVTTTPSAALATASTAPHRVESGATRPSLPVSGSTPITRAQPGTLAGIEQECAALLRLLMIRFPGAGQPAVSRTPEFVACVARRSSGHGVDATAIAMRCQAQVTDKLFLIKRVH